jgi:hypothetical protein
MTIIATLYISSASNLPTLPTTTPSDEIVAYRSSLMHRLVSTLSPWTNEYSTLFLSFERSLPHELILCPQPTSVLAQTTDLLGVIIWNRVRDAVFRTKTRYLVRLTFRAMNETGRCYLRISRSVCSVLDYVSEEVYTKEKSISSAEIESSSRREMKIPLTFIFRLDSLDTPPVNGFPNCSTESRSG